MICEYGCGKEAKYQFDNKKWCCSDSFNKCPASRKKNSETQKQCYNTTVAVVAATKKFNCKHCNKLISISGLSTHEKSCYLNPDNLKLCPVCNKPIKAYNNIKHVLVNVLDIYTEICMLNMERNNGCEKNHYRTICFQHHEKECIICGEKNIVEVHHYDCNHDNDLITNLIPLCPTHHRYMISRYKILIDEEVWMYYMQFISDQLIKYNLTLGI